MLTLDNERTGQQQMVPPGKEFICIFCMVGFWVYPRHNEHYQVPTQTLMCESCRIKIKSAMERFDQLNNM